MTPLRPIRTENERELIEAVRELLRAYDTYATDDLEDIALDRLRTLLANADQEDHPEEPR